VVRILWFVLIAAMLLTIAGSAYAYRLIVIPVAEVLPANMYKLEFSAPKSEALDKWLTGYRFDYSLGKGFEIATKSGSAPSNSLSPQRASSLDVNVNWQIAKETKSMPGYGMGVWNLYDSDDHAAVKEAFFAGAYKSLDVGLKFPVKVHVVAGTKQLNGVFGGVLIPLSKRCQAAAEWMPRGTLDGKSLRTPDPTQPGNRTKTGLAVAVGYNQSQHWRVKYANVGGDNAWGVVYTNTCGLCENIF